LQLKQGCTARTHTEQSLQTWWLAFSLHIKHPQQ
jgi:hypothetical protein